MHPRERRFPRHPVPLCALFWNSLSANSLPLFGPAHLAIVVAVPAVAAALAITARRRPGTACPIRTALGAFLLLNEIVWYVYQIHHGYLRFPGQLPLQLCDLAVWLAALAAFSRSARAFDLVWYWGLCGAGMAILTPDLWTPFPSYLAIAFFLSHGGVVATILFLAWSGLARPRPGSVRRAFIALNAVAAAIGAFDAVFGTNYFYLRQKPSHASLLDLLGPWPIYILLAEPLVLLLFWILWLPFRRADD
jgi:hypothetical integral membrane protein (TIGR02206 family)